MVNSHKMKGTGVPLDVMDFLYNELYFGVIEKRSCPYAPFVMNFICDTWLKTFKTNLGATEHLNLMFHEVKRIWIMVHLSPMDSEDAAPNGNRDGVDPSAAEPSWDKRLLTKVRKTFCLQLSIQDRQYEAHCNEKLARRRKKAMMRQLNLPVSKGSEDNITPKDRWISEHSVWGEDPLEPVFGASSSPLHDMEWASEQPWDE
jgi:hypothetical protein